MKLELNLLELNELYLATSRLVEQNQKHLDELGKNVSSINYFKTQLDSSKVLRDKIQTALYAEAKVLDEARDWVLKYKAEQYDRERDILKDSNSHFVSNDEADEDARDYSAFKDYAATIKQDEQRHNDKKLFTLNKNR
jgi:hypothetical protein